MKPATSHLGLVSWAERRVRAGWRWLRTSNIYRFLAPDGAVQAGMRARAAVPSTNRQDAGGGERVSKKEALGRMLAAAAAAPDLLLARRQVMEQRLATLN